MRTLIIDSHKGFLHEGVTNLHVRNAMIIARRLGATIVATNAVADKIAQQQWDTIIFNHASAYGAVDYECVRMNPKAELVYITNEYNLGEPSALWMAVKDGRKYQVIANHPAAASKVVKKYVSQWHIVNLNALIFDRLPRVKEPSLFDMHNNGAIYYGAYRAGREAYFIKYFDRRLTVSTSIKNIAKFYAISTEPRYIEKITWKAPHTLSRFTASLYIEDEKTHVHYNHLANRFYEALSVGVAPLFDESCRGTVEKSGYNIPEEYFINSADDLHRKAELCLGVHDSWLDQAEKEKEHVLNQIESIINQEEACKS